MVMREAGRLAVVMVVVVLGPVSIFTPVSMHSNARGDATDI